MINNNSILEKVKEDKVKSKRIRREEVDPELLRDGGSDAGQTLGSAELRDRRFDWICIHGRGAPAADRDQPVEQRPQIHPGKGENPDWRQRRGVGNTRQQLPVTSLAGSPLSPVRSLCNRRYRDRYERGDAGESLHPLLPEFAR